MELDSLNLLFQLELRCSPFQIRPWCELLQVNPWSLKLQLCKTIFHSNCKLSFPLLWKLEILHWLQAKMRSLLPKLSLKWWSLASRVFWKYCSIKVSNHAKKSFLITELYLIYRVFCGSKPFECADCNIPLKENFILKCCLSPLFDLQLLMGILQSWICLVIKIKRGSDFGKKILLKYVNV